MEAATYRPDLSVSRRFDRLQEVPGVTTFGEWQLLGSEHYGEETHGARLVPSQAPWRSLFAALDELGSSLDSTPVPTLEEADAIVATCLRYGSYFHVLTAGEYYPPFRKERSLSRITDSEMKRINLEMSSGVEAWLADRAANPTKTARRVRAALRLLPIAWRNGRPDGLNEFLNESGRRLAERVVTLAESFPAALAPLADTPLGLREEANRLVLTAFRDGRIEDLHAGTSSYGTQIPGFKRLYAGEVKAICRHAAEKIGLYLAARDHASRDPSPLVPLCLSWGFSGIEIPAWSLTDETSGVTYGGVAGSGPLGPRLRLLASHYPAVYGSAANAA